MTLGLRDVVSRGLSRLFVSEGRLVLHRQPEAFRFTAIESRAGGQPPSNDQRHVIRSTGAISGCRSVDRAGWSRVCTAAATVVHVLFFIDPVTPSS